MDIQYVLENLDVVRVCLSDLFNMKEVNQLVVENTANHLFDAVSELKGLEK